MHAHSIRVIHIRSFAYIYTSFFQFHESSVLTKQKHEFICAQNHATVKKRFRKKKNENRTRKKDLQIA